MKSFLKELRLSLRRLRNARWLSLTVILMLGLGIGATTAMFSLIEGILLRPLPFREPGRLVQLGEHVGNGPGIGVTARDIEAYATASNAFSSTAGYSNTVFEISGGAAPDSIPAARVTASLFATLGVQPVLGRAFTAEEEAGRAQVLLISDSVWLNRYHRDPRVIGASIELDRKLYTIIGVMSPAFDFPLQTGRLNQAQLWVPMSLTPDELSDAHAGVWSFSMVARLKDGVTLAEGAQDADRVAHQIMRNYPAGMAAIHIRGDVAPLSEIVSGPALPLLRALFVAVCVVLLIACANVAVLMLVRAIRSHREHAVRLALGARPVAILRNALWEGLLLSLAGGALGLAFTAMAVRAAPSLLPDTMPRVDSVAVDGPVALFALLAALATGSLCSLAPAFVAVRTNLMMSLKESVRTGSGGSSHSRLRSTLVVSEIAIALILLTASAAFLRSYQRMLAIDPGFMPEHVVVAAYQLPQTQYRSDAAVNTFYRTLFERLSATPGIAAAGIGTTLPSSGNSGLAAYTIEGERADGWKLKFAGFGVTYGNYFQALGIPLLAGRTFTPEDRADTPLVVIVSQAMAQHSWPGQNPVGKRMHAGNPKKGLPWATVVGVVGNTHLGSRDQDENDQWYVPVQQPATLFGPATSENRAVPASGFIVLRSALAPQQMLSELHQCVAEVDPLLPLTQVQSMQDVISKTEAPRRFMTELIGLFAIGALALAVAGIYAVMSFTVSMRHQEIAIRMALGARRDGIARLVLRSGLNLALLGCGIGIVGSLALSRLLRSYLFGVSSTDPLIYLACILLMLVVAMLGSLLPAARASREDPVNALRSM